MMYEIGDKVLLACIDEESLEEYNIGLLSGMEDYVGQHATIESIELTTTGHTTFQLGLEDGNCFWVSEECLAPIVLIQNLNKFFDL